MTIAKLSGPPAPSPPPASTGPAKATRPVAREFVTVLREQNTQRAEQATAAQRPSVKAANQPAQPPHAAAPVAGSDPATAARQLMQNALDADRRVDAVLRAAASGRTFSPAELLTLQAEVFRYSQTVEVISRGTDKLVGGIKQTLGTQV
jgi:hypothetical protein